MEYGLKLSKGQEALISSTEKPVNKIYIETGWDPSNNYEDMDIDSSVLVYSYSNPNKQEVICYHNMESKDKCIIHNGDNLTGEEGYVDEDDERYEGDVDEIIDVNLKDLKSDYDRLVVFINIFECESRNQTFEDVENLFIRVRKTDDNSTICEYNVMEKMRDDTLLVIGLFYKKDNKWTFKAVGQSYKFNSIEEFAKMVKEHKKTRSEILVFCYITTLQQRLHQLGRH